MAEFAANAAQGHIGRAKYLATNEEARKTREKILSIPFTVKDLSSAFEAANTLVELAKSQALAESEARDEAELAKLKESYGTTGSKLATGGSKAVKELEKEQKTRNARSIKNFLDMYLHDLAIKKMQDLREESLSSEDLEYVQHIQKSIIKLKSNVSPNLILESLLVKNLQTKY
jgi:DNA polymerase-3 subunit delta'